MTSRPPGRPASHSAALALAVAMAAGALLPGLSLLTGVGPGALRAQGLRRPEVTSLRFSGNEAFSDDELASSILTRETRCWSFILRPFCWAGSDFAWDRRYLSDRTLEDDYVRVYLFYRERGYRGIQVDTTLTRRDETVRILFDIDEGEPHRITALDVRGLEDVPDPPVTQGLTIGEGDPLDLVALDAVRDTLTRRLQNRGYAHAEVLRNIFIPAGTREAEVEFDVYPGPVARFGPIDIEGNESVSDRVIQRMLVFREGGLYRRELLFDAQRNLYGLEIFLNASITEDLQNEPDSIVPLRVQVNEGNAHRVRVGGGWNTEECFNIEALWANRNYFGGARRLQLRGRVSNLLTNSFEQSVCSSAGSGAYGDLDWVVGADFSQPFIFTPRNSFAASVFAERQSLQNVYVRKAVGLTVSLTRSVGRQTPLTLSYSPEVGRLDAAEVFFCTSFLVCDPTEIDVLQSSNVLAPVGLSISRDRSDSPISPTSGYRGLLDLESAGAWTGSDFAYERAVAEITGYHPMAGDMVVAGRFRAGWLRAGTFEGLSGSPEAADRRIAHPEKRFYAGGSNSVRGYAQNQLGPQVLSIEVRRLISPTAKNAEAVCSPEEVVALTCDASSLLENQFSKRPTGGTRLIEGNLELRFPLWGVSASGAAFLDFGRVWDAYSQLSLDDMVFTPGLGFRYATPIGPVRVDLAYRGSPFKRVPVVTSQIRPYDPEVDEERDRIVGTDGVPLDWVRRGDLALLGPNVGIGGSGSFWGQLQLHLSIGQAF